MIIRLADLLEAAARRDPDAPALTARGDTVCYATLQRLVERAAAGLREVYGPTACPSV
jgi:non-ribosomal peptide synthetase component E (peptide arylation enzyme)